MVNDQTAEQKLAYWKKRANDHLSAAWKAMADAQTEANKGLLHAGGNIDMVKQAMFNLGQAMALLVKEVDGVTIKSAEPTPAPRKGGSHAETKANEPR